MGEAMILESAVREKLADFARGAVSYVDFADWIDRESWSMHRDSGPGAIELVSSIHGLFAERDAGALDAEAVRNELLSLLNNVSAVMVIAGRAVVVPDIRPSGSSIELVPRPPQDLWMRPVQAVSASFSIAAG